MKSVGAQARGKPPIAGNQANKPPLSTKVHDRAAKPVTRFRHGMTHDNAAAAG
jgi:hypothetical protein